VSADNASTEIAETWIESGEWNGWTGADGRCEIGYLPAGIEIRVSVSSSDTPAQEEPTPLALRPREQRAIEILFAGTGSIVGRLVDTHGTGIANQRVQLVRTETPVRAMFRWEQGVDRQTDETGRFRFDSVPAGLWLVGIAGPIGSPESDRQLVGLAEIVEVVGGPVDVTVHAEPALSIAGRVLAPDGGGVSLAVVVANTAAHAIASSDSVCDVEGRFRVSGLIAGPWNLRVLRADNGWIGADDATVEAGRDDVVLHVVRGARISVRVVDDATGEPVTEASIGCASLDESMGLRWFEAGLESREFEGLLPGRYTIWASTPAGRFGAAREVTVGSGDHIDDLVVAVHAAARVRIRNQSDTTGWFQVSWRGANLGGDDIPPGVDYTVVVPSESITVEFGGVGEMPRRSHTLSPAAATITDVVFGNKP
jgi:hypothetical protein